MNPSKEAFVLGAGFSRAISDMMPLTDDLGRRLAEADPGHFGSIRGSFETWLSHRADPQPYLDAAGNLGRQADFARATNLIAGILDECVEQVLARPLPSWLGELISLWHLRESRILTFNYDPLIECAFESLSLHDWRAGSGFQWGSLINYNPPGKPGRSFGEADGTSGPHPSLRLWKLHGSTNWFWVPGDKTGATALRGRLPGRFGAPRPILDSERNWSAPGRERFLVPPAAAKSSYYRNPVTREIWSRGYEALCEAEVITLMGYSLPLTDLTTSGMLAEAIAVGNVREIRLVDVAAGRSDDPSSLTSRVERMATADVDVLVIGAGADVVPAYVSRLVGEAAENATRQLASWSPEGSTDPEVIVHWGDSRGTEGTTGRSASVIDHRGIDSNGTLRLVAETLRTLDAATWNRTATDSDPGGDVLPMRWRTLSGLLNSARRVVVAVPGVSREVTVIAHTYAEEPLGRGGGAWLRLIPAGSSE